MALFEARPRALIRRKKVTSKLVVAAPPSELVDSALQVIAEGYGINWKPPGSNDADEGGLKVRALLGGYRPNTMECCFSLS
jgi:hypothetical protein